MNWNRILLAFAFNLLLVSSLFGQRSVSITSSAMRVADILERIEATTDYRFVYQTNAIDPNRTYRPNWQRQSIELVLKSLFEGTATDYKIKGNQIILLARPQAIPQVVAAPETKITGILIDEKNEPLVGVSVYTELANGKPDHGTFTDANGHFQLVAEVGDWLKCTMVGYTSLRLKITDLAPLKLQMKPAESALGEVVVVGYGEVSRRDLTGRVSTLNSQQLLTMPTVTSFDRMIGGKMAGVYAAQVSGQPGASAMVNIRGVASLRGNNQPLYIVDGVPIVSSENQSEEVELNSEGNIRQMNPLLAINPNDIESISVLKDASAAAMYGSRAANGVIIVTTKRGAKNTDGIQVEIQSQTSIENPVRTFKMMDATQYRSYLETLARNTLSLEANDDEIIDKNFAEIVLSNKRSVEGKPYFQDANTNWQRLLTRRNFGSQQLSLSAYGNTGKMNFYFGTQLNRNLGVFVGNSLNRYGIQANMDISANRWLSLGTSINIAATRSKETGVNNYEFTYFNPTIDANQRTAEIGLEGQSYSPYDLLNNSINQEGQNILGNVYAEISLLKNMQFRSELAASQLKSDGTEIAGVEVELVNGLRGRKVLSNSSVVNTTLTNTLTYRPQLAAKHSLDMVVGMAFDNRLSKSDRIGFVGFASNDMNALPGQQIDRAATMQTAQQAVLHSYFLRSNYHFNNRYYATVTTRLDGSSKFGPHNRWGIFPSAAFSWRISEEDFMQSKKWLDDLSLKFSLGRTGNSNLPTFAYFNAYVGNTINGTLSYGEEAGVISTQIPNPNIKWEYTNQYDLSSDFSMLNRKLYGSAGLYLKQSRNVIAYPNVLLSTGYRTQLQNIGSINNMGLELELGSSVLQTNNLNWDISFNLTHNRNRLQSLNNANAFAESTPESVVEGRPLGGIYGYVVEGIIQSEEELKALNQKAPSGKYSDFAKVGNFKYKDFDGDGEITFEDQRELGNTQPKWFGGFASNLHFKRWQLYADFQTTLGQSFIYGHHRLIRYGDYAVTDRNQVVGALDNTWSPTNPTGQYEFAAMGGQSQDLANSRMVFRTDFLRFKSLSVQYELPLLKSTAIRKAQFRFTANNLFTLTKWPGLDPESMIGSGQTFSTAFTTESVDEYPLFRSFNLGVNIGF